MADRAIPFYRGVEVLRGREALERIQIRHAALQLSGVDAPIAAVAWAEDMLRKERISGELFGASVFDAAT